MQQNQIADDTVVVLHYQLTLDDGSIADSSFGGEPLAYLHGHGNIVPGLERQLAGHGPGDKLEASVEPADGYGDFDPEAFHELPRSAFPRDAKLEAGMGFHSQDDEGNVVPLFIKELRDEEVIVTTNHPLAGQRLNFRVEIVSVRKATKQELEHGHVHGPGGHHH